MSKMKFERVFQTVAHMLGENPTIELPPEELQERIKELQSCFQGLAGGHESFANAFLMTLKYQVKKMNLNKFNQMRLVVDQQINSEDIDPTTAWVTTYAESYPYKATEFSLRCEDNCNELEAFFDYTCYPDVAKIAKELYCK